MTFPTIKKLPELKLIGIQRVFSTDTAYAEIPRFWEEIFARYGRKGCALDDEMKRAFSDNRIGEYGVCVDDMDKGSFRYLIAGKYAGGEVPDGMVTYEFPPCEWAIFDCYGPLPDALQNTTTQVFEKWLPENGEYEAFPGASVEWYESEKDPSSPDYHSAVWVPVKRK